MQCVIVKNLNFSKNKKQVEILNSLRIKTLLSKIPCSWKYFSLKIIKEDTLYIISDCMIFDHKKSRFLESYAGSNNVAAPRSVCYKNVSMKKVCFIAL